MTTRTPGKGWLRNMAARVTALDGVVGDDSPMPFPDFDALLTEACGARQSRGNDVSQGPDEFVQRHVGRRQFSKWFGDHALTVHHDADQPRTVHLAYRWGMGSSRHKHVWVDPDAHGAWIAGGAGAGWGVGPIEFECRHLSVDEIVVLTEAVHNHALRSAAQWNFRCTPKQLVEVTARARSQRRSLYPWIGRYRDFETIDSIPIHQALLRDLDDTLKQGASRIVELFAKPNARAA